MLKLPAGTRFLNLFDYARPVAVWIVETLRSTRVTSIQLTFAFFVVGVASIACIVTGHYLTAVLLLMFKNVLDAADGEMARVRQRPSHTGRYLDSVFDFVINLGVVAALYMVVEVSLQVAVLAFISLEFQGSIYNYYHLNQRRLLGGDTTSSINEFERPCAFPYENARIVAILNSLYLLCYGVFDRLMLALEGDAIKEPLPNWFMTVTSTMGLGFQLLLISLALVLPLADLVLPFLCIYGGFGMAIILTRNVMSMGETSGLKAGIECSRGVK